MKTRRPIEFMFSPEIVPFNAVADAMKAAEKPLPTRAHVPASIDLHGMTTDAAQSALDEFLSDAILAGHHEIRVIHGRSGGRLKAMVHARLRAMTSVRAFRLDPANPGVTIVVF